ncbi:unnamed protein product [Caenorhabditis auriculariae]|uniref:G-protein coupled receptors family 1 profile domain-containing protein n=1 Tax=Caenorhabditis auriculariae TaxID=2777116 RepID=A0A8S1HM14_9PELO|nr:unnamed protein product [Caenorhabditis auriculariae]
MLDEGRPPDASIISAFFSSSVPFSLVKLNKKLPRVTERQDYAIMSDQLAQLVRDCAARVPNFQIDDVVQRQSRWDNASSTILRMAPAFSIIAFVFCIILLGAIIFALLRRRIPSRKYSFVISRTAADIFSSALIASATLLANKWSASYAVMALFLYVATFGLVQSTLSHLAIIVLRHISVTRPYGFQSMCSIRRLSMAIAFTWCISILYAAAFAPLATAIIDPSKTDNVCSYSNCQRPLIITAICIIAISMSTVVVCYGFVVAKLRQISYSERMHNEPNVTRRKLFKFLGYGGHVALYLFITALVLSGAIIIAHNLFIYNNVRAMVQRNCDVLDYIDTIIRLETLAGGAVLLWTVRIIFDVVIVFATEYPQLVPWLVVDNLEPLRNNQIMPVRHGLTWQKGCVNCPVFSIENRLHRYDMKN